jgi:phenylalanyl-tRNA synthetase beta chain
MRPINNVVDATNYVMLECGQPLHPFDFERLAEGRVLVRKARLGERFTTLDGKLRDLDPAMTMIADAKGAVGIGGVMGGLDSEVTDATTTVFLESAHFDPARTARTARKLGIASEAAARFGRGVDPALPAYALDRAAGLMAEIAEGDVSAGRVGVEGRPEPRYVALRFARALAVIGLDVEPHEARSALESLGDHGELRGNVGDGRADLAFRREPRSRSGRGDRAPAGLRSHTAGPASATRRRARPYGDGARGRRVGCGCSRRRVR